MLTEPEILNMGMMSKTEFTQRLIVQSDTIDRYIRNKKITPDYEIPVGKKLTKKFFSEQTLLHCAEQFNWTIITSENKFSLFIDYIHKMSMKYAYKPLLIKAFFKYADVDYSCSIDYVADYFIKFYENRKQLGKIVEHPDSEIILGLCSRESIKKCIIHSPVKRFYDMGMMEYDKDLEMIKLDPIIKKSLTEHTISQIIEICDNNLNEYFTLLPNNIR